MSWRCVPSTENGEVDGREEKALGNSWGCEPIWTPQHDYVQVKKTKAESGPLGEQRLLKGEQDSCQYGTWRRCDPWGRRRTKKGRRAIVGVIEDRGGVPRSKQAVWQMGLSISWLGQGQNTGELDGSHDKEGQVAMGWEQPGRRKIQIS